MAQDVKYITFDQVDGAPRLAVPKDFDQTQIDNYLKSEQVENAMFEKGFLFKYGLQPVNMLEMENLDDGSFISGFKRSYDNMKALGQGRVAAFYDFVNNPEKQQEALRIAEQYQLDSAAHAYRYDPETGQVIPRPNTVEDIFSNEQQLTAFTRYVKGTMGSAAASSIPTILLSTVGAVAGGLLAGPPGAAGGATIGALISGYSFGLGENYLAQAEETDDPNLGISLAMAVPYAAAERLGIGGVVPSMIKTFGGRSIAVKALNKPGGLLHEIEKNVLKKGIGKATTELGKGMLKTGTQEALAETIQEAVTTTAGGLESDKTLAELYGNKEFAKQLGEAASAGFFGGFGFGVVNPALKQIKQLGERRGIEKDLKGLGGTFNVDTNAEQEAFNRNVKLGDIVTVANKYNKNTTPERQEELESLFKKPQFRVYGTTMIDDVQHYVLQSRDLGGAVATVPVTEIDSMTIVADEGLGGGDKAENFTYTQAAEDQTAIDAQQKQNFKQNKENLQRGGWLKNRGNTEAEQYLGGKEKIIGDVVNEIEVQRSNQKETETDEGSLDFVDNIYKKYDAFSGDRLREEVAKDYNYWLRDTFNRESEGVGDENFLSKEDKETLDELGYYQGDRGRAYIDRQVTNTTKIGKGETEGGRNLRNIINSAKTDKPIRFERIASDKGGPVEVERVVGEKVRVNEPVTAEERASLTGERLLNVIKYDPRTYTESSTFEDLYKLPLVTRIQQARKLGEALDSRGWKNKQVNNVLIKEATASFNRAIATARFNYGLTSESYKKAVQAKKDFLNRENHILTNPFAPKGEFSLIPILSPKAIRQAERELVKLRADARSRSTDPAISDPIIKQIEAYQHIINHTPFARKQLNDLLQTMSIEPIIDWETFTSTKLKSTLSAYTKKVNRRRREVKKTPIKETVTMYSQKESGDTYTNPGINTEISDDLRVSIAYTFREMLDKLGLPGIDLGLVKDLTANGEFSRLSKKGEILSQEIIGEVEEDFGQISNLAIKDFRLIKLGFDFDSFNNAKKANDKVAMTAALFQLTKTLNHEVIHALYNAGAFTKTEWKVLTKVANDKFIPFYLPKGSSRRKFYEGKFKEEKMTGDREGQTLQDYLIEEAMAHGFADFSIGNNQAIAEETKIQKIFRKLKALILSLIYGLKTTGFNSPLDIFDNIQAGIVGQRIETDFQALDMATHSDINRMALDALSGDGTIILSNKIDKSDVNKVILADVYTSFLNKFMSPNAFENINVKFSMKPGKVRWATKYRDKSTDPGMNLAVPMGLTAETEGYQSLYVPMSVKQYQSLVPVLNYKDQYSTASIKALTQGIEKGFEIGAPFLEIDINPDTLVGRVTSHEGRHRTFTTGLIHGDQTVVPVGIVFKVKGVREFKNNPQGRQDPVNKKILEDFLQKGTLFAQGTFRTEINYKGDKVTAANITSFPEVQRLYPGIQPTVKPSKVINKVFQEYETTETGDYRFSKEYNNEDNYTVSMYNVGEFTDETDTQNRQETRDTTRKLDKAEKDTTSGWDGENDNYTYENMSAFAKFLGHARTWAKKNTPFRFLYGAVMNQLRYGRHLQAGLTAQLRRRYLEVKKDPYMAQLLDKAHIISQMTGTKVTRNEKDELVFIAPKDSSDKNSTVKAGEMVVLTGDVAGAFEDHQTVMESINKEFLKAEIARDHIPNLLSALDLLRQFNPRLPELQTVFNFEGLTEDQISYKLENLDPAQIRFIHKELSAIMLQYSTSPQLDIFYENAVEEVDVLLGNKTSGLNKLRDVANAVEGRQQVPYAPLSRFGEYYISVKDPNNLDEDGKPLQLWYQQFETNADAQQAYTLIRVKFPDAEVSKPARQTIQEMRARLKNAKKPYGLEYISQYLSDTNAKKYNEAVKELRQSLAQKGLDKNVLGINQFFAQRDKSVGMEGVPGYDPDFTRSTLQYIAIASQSIARNRFNRDANKAYDNTIKFAEEKGDNNLITAAEKFYKYTEDPTHEFAFARRIGFWWYLGGNLSSALLQIMSAVQFTGPILSQLGGTKATATELAKSLAFASAMAKRGTVNGERQYEDAFLDFEYIDTIKDTEPELYEALYNSIADGTIKQGQALQEAGMVEGLGDASRGNRRTIKKIENVLVGGAFNTMESVSRLTAFIAAFRLAKNNPDVMKNADIMFEGDMDYQNHKDMYGDSPAAFARFMTEETFGVYGKENRPWMARNFGALPALFMTYITQMFGLLGRLLNPPTLKFKDGRLSMGAMDINRSKAANIMGRKAFARIMLMLGLTGGLMGLPGAEDAEDIINGVKKLITGVDSDIRTEFRNMLYEAGWNTGLIEAMEAGLLNSYLNIDVQARIGFGIAPWSRQVRAGLSMMGLNTGARVEEFLGAPGSVFLDPAKALINNGLREGDYGEVFRKMLPTSVRNITKVMDYKTKGYVQTGYGQVVTDDLSAMDLIMQTVGFTPTELSKNREALYLERKLDRAASGFKQRMNAQITNALRNIILGGQRKDASLINDGQAEIKKLLAKIVEHNVNNPPHMVFIPDMSRLQSEALKAINPQYRIGSTNQKTVAEKMRLRKALGLD